MSLRSQGHREIPPRARVPLSWYRPATFSCLLVGAVATSGLRAVGLPILFLGLVLLPPAPALRNRRILWPMLVGTVFFVLTGFFWRPDPARAQRLGSANR